MRCVCGGENGRRGGKGDIWWWNEMMKDAISRIAAHKVMDDNPTEENGYRFGRMTNRANKEVSKAMGWRTNDWITEIVNCSN